MFGTVGVGLQFYLCLVLLEVDTLILSSCSSRITLKAGEESLEERRPTSTIIKVVTVRCISLRKLECLNKQECLGDTARQGIAGVRNRD